MTFVDSGKASIDARPIVPIDEKSLWAEASQRREEIALEIERVVKSKDVLAQIVKSQPGEYPVSLRLVAWLPKGRVANGAVTHRSDIVITFGVLPYRENSISYTIDVKKSDKTWRGETWNLKIEDVAELALFAIDAGPVPVCLRWQTVTAVMTVALPFLFPRNKLLKTARPNWLAPANLLLIFGVVLIVLSASVSVMNLGVIAGIAALAVSCVSFMRLRGAIVMPGQPKQPPRRLYVVDTWHTCVPNVVSEFAEFRSRILDGLRALDPSIAATTEIHQYLAPEGLVEREHFVLAKGQAVIHVHVYPFANDAFVGWTGYLNWARWLEGESLATRIEGGERLDFKSLTVGVHIPSHHDLVELNALSELVHRHIGIVLKQVLEEKKMEATMIDFKVIHGSREAALNAGKSNKSRR